MKIMRCLNSILTIALIQISPCLYAGELSSDLSERLQYAQEEEYISAIVRMVDQADLKMATKGILGRNKALRSRNVIRKLQSTAKERQGDLITLLEKEKSLNNVLNYTSFWIFNGLSIKATPSVIEMIALREDVEIINLDFPISLPDPIQTVPPKSMTMQVDSRYTWNIKRINAPEVWEMGYDGSGVVVGVFDSGADITHPDLVDKYRGGDNSWFDYFGEHEQPVDLDGHGTHVTGIILGGNDNGKHIGVAPGAQFIVSRYANDADEGSVTNLIPGFQWFLDPDGDPETNDAPDVINNSWHEYDFLDLLLDCRYEFKDAIKALRMAGIVPVFAASNDGPLPFTGSSPAITPGTIVVGSTNFFDAVVISSSRGPNICDLSIYPDLCAPGRHIFSSIPNEDYEYWRGTSMAAPQVTGVIALMLDANPDLTADEIESILKTTANPVGLFHPNYSCGWGRVDALAAVNAALALE